MDEVTSAFYLIEDENESVSFFEKHKFDPIQKVSLWLNDLPYEFENSVQNTLPSFKNELFESFQIEFYTIKTTNFKHLIVCDKIQKKIFIMDFFYSSLSQESYIEMKLYFFVIQTYLNSKQSDILLDIEPYRKEFLPLRKTHLDKEALNILCLDHLIHALGLTLIYLSRSKLPSLSHFEKKILREILSSKKLKDLLNLREDAFDYIKKGRLEDDKLSLEKSHHLGQYIRDNAQDIMDYASKRLSKKRILLWFWWTISPFLSKDTSLLLDILSQEMSIKSVYLDLPSKDQAFFDAYIQAENINDDELDKRIKEIYPPFFDDYQKESILYIKTIKKLKNLSKSFHCMGQTGDNLLRNVPYINEELKLEFPTESHWLQSISNEINNIHHLKEGEIILFIQFLKPMLKIPKIVMDNELIESLIHVDQFTGFSPYAPYNSIASFSFHSSNKKSFVLSDVDKSYLKKESIIYIPEDDNEIYPIDHSKFNQFSLYKTLLYSFHSNGGGNKSPQIVPDLHYQY